MPRLFTAIEIPDDIGEDLYRLRMPLPGARWIHRQNYHITLRFVGDVDNRRAREFAANLGMIEPDGFELQLAELGFFGGDDPHALWAGVTQSEQLQDLARAHERAARQAGLPPETRAFKPHVTLARLAHTNVSALARFLTRHGGYRSETFFVGRTVLMSSRPSVGGGPYAIEERFAMRGMGFLNDDEGAAW